MKKYQNNSEINVAMVFKLLFFNKTINVDYFVKIPRKFNMVLYMVKVMEP